MPQTVKKIMEFLWRPKYGNMSLHRKEGENFIQTIKLFFLMMLPNEGNWGGGVGTLIRSLTYSCVNMVFRHSPDFCNFRHMQFKKGK
jgi:hypothetical protein